MADNLRVLQICSATELIYGAAHSLMTLARAQREAGKTVEFIAFKGKPFAEQVRAEGFEVHEVRVRAKVDIGAVFQMRRIIEEGRFDIVHAHLSTSSVNGGLAARFARVPGIATVHGMSSKWSFGTASHLIGVSNQVKSHLIDQGVPKDRVSVVYNGLEPRETPSPLGARSLLGIPAEALVAGTVSRITPMKAIDDAIRAVASLKDVFPNLIYQIGRASCRERVLR